MQIEINMNNAYDSGNSNIAAKIATTKNLNLIHTITKNKNNIKFNDKINIKQQKYCSNNYNNSKH